MRLVNYKIINLGPKTFKLSVKLLRRALIELSLYVWRFELIETKSTFQIRFTVKKSDLSKVENTWLRRLYMSFINKVR